MRKSEFLEEFEKEYNNIQNKKNIINADDITLDLMKERGNKILYLAAFCVLFAALCVIIFKNALVIIPFACIIAFLLFKLYFNYKLLRNNNIVVIESVCTNKKQDVLNFGVNKIYEFEPINSEQYNDLIFLSIANEDTGGLFKKNQKIKIGYTYYLAFKKNDDKKYSNENFLCFKRSVYNESESKENKINSNT